MTRSRARAYGRLKRTTWLGVAASGIAGAVLAVGATEAKRPIKPKAGGYTGGSSCGPPS